MSLINRCKTFQKNSEQLQDGKERGITQTCLPFQESLESFRGFTLSRSSWFFNHKLIHCRLTFFLLNRKFVSSQLPPLYITSFQFLYLLKTPRTIFLRESFCSVQSSAWPILLSWNDQIISRNPSFGNEATDLVLEEICLHFRPSILAYPARIGLQTVKIPYVPPKATSYDITASESLDTATFFSSSSLISSLFKEVAVSRCSEWILSFSSWITLLHNMWVPTRFSLVWAHRHGFTVLVRTCDERVSELFLSEW